MQFLITFFQEFTDINPVSLTILSKTIQCIILRLTIINTKYKYSLFSSPLKQCFAVTGQDVTMSNFSSIT